MKTVVMWNLKCVRLNGGAQKYLERFKICSKLLIIRVKSEYFERMSVTGFPTDSVNFVVNYF